MNTFGNISVEGGKTLGGILNEGRLRVPANQREFSWKQTHVRELFQDIKPIIDDRSGQEYFLGTVVVLRNPQDPNRYRTVVDGQQRLATVAIFLAAVRDYFVRENDDDGVKSVEPEYLLKIKMPERKIIPQLQLNDNDHSFFEHRVLSRAGTDERKQATHERHRSSHRLIHQAANTASDQVASIVRDEKSENRAAALTRWVDFFSNQARVIMVIVEDEAVAYTVFETMNDRGLELSATDLIKNRLFSLSQEQLDQTKRNWAKMLGILESIQSTTIVKDYVRHYWISKHGRTRAPVLFKAIREEVSNQKRAIDFAAELEKNALQYVALLNPENELWHTFRPIMKDYISALTTLDVKQIRPLLISVLAAFPKGEAIKAFRLMISICVRLMAADQLGRGSLETEYESAALEVYERKITTAAALTNKLKSIIPADNKFREDFATFEVTNEPHARYLLKALDVAETGLALTGMSSKDEPTLEHLLPLNPKHLADWPFTSEEHEDYVHQFGNQALLPNESNSTAGSEKFTVKRLILARQPNQLTKEIGQLTAWGRGEIDTRQKRLAAIATKAWPLRV
ncbi:MAG: DUF262 domain-containing protein [Candidatus Binatus sp.]|uniref:DUF262 domain-containing protein n=1 Tax=Candidatus Binatus sp. TaxID=2811406 RepID=UPI00271F13A8|nr:DUF262 domain-containing protein [Candidatus Binatus sp.]MDO8431225.1 DUF262 domain-containing protein [Candidatus Binatus sp.]